MASKLVFLAAAFAVALAVPLSVPPSRVNILENEELSVRNSALEQLLAEAIESLRSLIQNGSGNIPALDPLEVPSLSLDDSIIPLPGAQVELRDLTVSNLGTFEINNLRVNSVSLLLQRYRIVIEGRIPLLDVKSDFYDLFITALGFDIFGTGEAKLKIINPRVNINIVVGPRITIQGLFLNLIETNIQFGLSEFVPEITGLFNHEGASDFASKFLENLVPSLVTAYESEINDFLSTTVHDILGPILAELDLADLISPSDLDLESSSSQFMY